MCQFKKVRSGKLMREKEVVQSKERRYFTYINFRDKMEAELNFLGRGKVQCQRRKGGKLIRRVDRSRENEKWKI